eukprot:3383894-Heterocapsa_arctica.AAC.1
MALEDNLAKHIVASEKVQKELTDLNIQYVRNIEALTATNAQSICDREVTDQQAHAKDALIKQLTDSIT